MERHIHNMKNLFSQLGQPSDDEAIARFLAKNRPLPNGVPLHEADFWTPSQASFLRDAVSDDGPHLGQDIGEPWHLDKVPVGRPGRVGQLLAEVVEALNAELHARQRSTP